MSWLPLFRAFEVTIYEDDGAYEGWIIELSWRGRLLNWSFTRRVGAHADGDTP